MSRLWTAWLGGALLVLALGLPWAGARRVTTPGGPSCIADLSGGGAMICDYIGVPSSTIRAGAVGAESPARLFLVLAVVLTAYAVWSRRRSPILWAAGAALAAVAIALPQVRSGQVVTLLAAGLLLGSVRDLAQRVRSLRSATWGDTAGSSPRPSAR